MPVTELIPEEVLNAGDHLFAVDYEQISAEGFDYTSNPEDAVVLELLEIAGGD